MQKYINDLKLFYQKYRWWFIGILFFLLMMQLCSQGGRVRQAEVITEELNETFDSPDEAIEPIRPMTEDVVNKGDRRGTRSLLFLMLLGLLFYVAMRRKLFNKFMPSIVWISLNIKGNRSKGQRLARISIMNKTNANISVEAPVIVFYKTFNKKRKFQLKSGGQNLFPLTLTHGTSHQLSIDILKFRQKTGLDKSYRWVKVELTSDGTKSHSSFWHFL